MDDEQRRLKKQWQSEERAGARAVLPLDDGDLADLFQTVDARLSSDGCDHSLRFTEAWITNRALPAEPVLEWLADNGGYCDCEVVANAQDAWEQTREGPGRSSVDG